MQHTMLPVCQTANKELSDAVVKKHADLCKSLRATFKCTWDR